MLFIFFVDGLYIYIALGHIGQYYYFKMTISNFKTKLIYAIRILAFTKKDAETKKDDKV